MNNTKKATLAPTAIVCTSFQQIVSLALDIAEERLQRLMTIYWEDGTYDQDVTDIDYAVRVGFESLKNMRAIEFKDHSELDRKWFGLTSILKMGTQVLLSKDSHYGRALVNTYNCLEQMRDTVEFVQLQGSRGTIRAT